MEKRRIILASGSPRRRELLAQAGYEFEVVTSNADELAPGQLEPRELAIANARVKTLAVARRLPEAGAVKRGAAGGSVVIGADTIVVADGRVFGKPADEAQAAATLRALSGRAHEVITGVCLVAGEECEAPAGTIAFAETTRVYFKRLDDAQIAAYIATGEPMDKAGAYGIQGKGAALVDHIEGDYDNVVGLPVARLARALDQV